MAKKNETLKALEDKLASLKEKAKILSGRGWNKAEIRNENFIKEVEAEISKLSKAPASKPATDK
jgi:hypothetical protein